MDSDVQRYLANLINAARDVVGDNLIGAYAAGSVAVDAGRVVVAVAARDRQWADCAARRRVSQAPATAAKRMPFARCHLLSIRCRSALSVGTAPANRERLTVRTRYPVNPTAATVLAAAAAIMGLSPPERQLLIKAAVVAARVNG